MCTRAGPQLPFPYRPGGAGTSPGRAVGGGRGLPRHEVLTGLGVHQRGIMDTLVVQQRGMNTHNASGRGLQTVVSLRVSTSSRPTI